MAKADIQEIVIDINDFDTTAKTLNSMGYKTTKQRNKNANGVDIFAIKDDYVLSVEIKKADKKKNGNVYRITGKFRGWICDRCNRILGSANDNPDILTNIIKYLIKNNKNENKN